MNLVEINDTLTINKDNIDFIKKDTIENFVKYNVNEDGKKIPEYSSETIYTIYIGNNKLTLTEEEYGKI